ncbi:MAG: tyrosine-type recombinase/integrase [Hyphomicrobiaceae bacterium]
MAFYADRHELFDGACLLYRRMSRGKVHPIWQMRIKLRTGYQTLSSKTRNYENAVLVAKAELDRINRRVADGAPIKDRTFAQHWNDWFDREVRKNTWKPDRQKWHQKYFDRHLSDYFGTKPLNDITLDFAEGYWEWRINYWLSNEGQRIRANNPQRRNAKSKSSANSKNVPANKTLHMEQTALNQIFADAHRRRFMQYPIKLKAPKPNRGDTRRPAFDEAEWIVLTQNLHDWAEGRGPYRNDQLNAYHRRQRQQLRTYVLFMASSGLRVGEARILRWGDLSDIGKHFAIKVRDATKRGARVVVPLEDTGAYLADWFMISGKPGPQELVFQGQNGSNHAATDMNKTFQSFLRRVPYADRPDGLLCDAEDERRTVYSLRHTYATLKLLRGELTEFDLARNMGTSVAQIERHYDLLDFFGPFLA